MADALTAKQKAFVAEYLIDLNATQAAIRAGYSEKTAYSIGNENLSKPEISDAIAAAQLERSRRTEITQDMVVTELAKVGFSDLRSALKQDGTLVGANEWDDSFAGAVASFEVIKKPSGDFDDDGKPIMHQVHKIKTWDKISALEKIGKHLGMFRDVIEHTGADGAPLIPELSDTEVARRMAFILAKGLEDSKNG